MDYTAEIPGVYAVTLYEARLCRFFVECADQINRWIEASVYHDAPGHHNEYVVDPEVRSAHVLPLGYAPAIARMFDESVRQVITPLVYDRWLVHLPQHSGAQMIRYLPGGQHIVHQDRGPGTENQYFTILCYLNDDFRGGATSFPDFNYAETPRCGKAIIFPAEYWHCAEPVIDGCKYVLVSWLLGPDRIRWI